MHIFQADSNFKIVFKSVICILRIWSIFSLRKKEMPQMEFKSPGKFITYLKYGIWYFTTFDHNYDLYLDDKNHVLLNFHTQHNIAVKMAYDQILTSTFTSCTTLGKKPNLSTPFLRLQPSVYFVLRGNYHPGRFPDPQGDTSPPYTHWRFEA